MVYFSNAGGLKTTETLLGIETHNETHYLKTRKLSQNYWNPLRDWNIATMTKRKQTKGLKTTETLLGIETEISWFSEALFVSQNYWNPFRDWNKND